MEWFLKIFLPSIDKKIGSSRSCWVSEKQANVFRKYMEESMYYPFFYIVVGDFQYTLSMFNGYGRITKENKEVAYH